MAAAGRVLFRNAGGSVVLPPSLLIDRADGGHLCVLPARAVWERSELDARELTAFSFLVAAFARGMIDALPQLRGGCVNYWEAGNWSLHPDAEPRGPKRARRNRRVHLHLIGRSPRAAHPSWQWGEAPGFPAFHQRQAWSAGFAPLLPEECAAIAERGEQILTERYGQPRRPR